MEKKVKEELDKLIIIGNESGMLRTSTVKQLLNDLNKKTEEDFEDAVQYVEEKNIGLNTDDSENKLFLDSSKIAIVPKTLSVESIVKKIRYDENKELTGETIYKGQDVAKGRYYITVVVFIQNSKNEFLIQKRVKKKDGKWATTGGHPVSGETSKQGIITEIKEELGVDIVKENIKLFKTIKTEDDFVDIYYVKEDIDIKKIKIQKEEVEDVKWATIEEINELIKNEAFSESHTEFFELCLDYLKLK